jgi:putative endonuclease
MNLWHRLRQRFAAPEEPEHLRRGRAGEDAAKRHLQSLGLKFLTANFKSKRGEIDLVFREGECLVFVEVKTRTEGGWVRPAGAVNARKRRLLSKAALDYLKLLPDRRVSIRFDIVEVFLHNGGVTEVRHLPNSFPLSKPYRHG